jgi:hypothetical protein
VGLVSAEEFKRRRDIIEKGLAPNAGQLDNNHLKKRKPTEANLQTLIKTKNVGQLSFADEAEEVEIALLPKKEKKKEESKAEPAPSQIVVPKVPKPRVNLLEEDEETKRQKQEALEVNSSFTSSA